MILKLKAGHVAFEATQTVIWFVENYALGNKIERPLHVTFAAVCCNSPSWTTTPCVPSTPRERQFNLNKNI
jgi:hypothetical protein